MRKILRIAKREYRTSVRTKGFIIALVLMPVMMGGSGLAMYLFQGQVDTRDKKVIVLDQSGFVADVILRAAEARNEAQVMDKETGKKVKPAWLFERIEPDRDDPLAQRLALSDRIRSGELHAFLEIGPNVKHPQTDWETARISYYAQNAAIDNIRGWLTGPINSFLRKARLEEAGVEADKAETALTWLEVAPLGLVSLDEAGQIKEAQRSSEAQAILAPLIMFFLFFMMIMMGAMPQLQSVMEEKSQRIAEVLLGSIKPFEFMAGKVLGGLAVSLTAASVYVVGGVFLLRRLGMAEFVPYHILPWFFAYLVLAIVMFGSILAALGSTCNDAKDAQNLTFPAMIPVFIPMFMLMPILQEPTSTFATALSLFPPFTPMLMLLRVSAPVGIPMWQPWVGLIGVIIFALLSIYAGGRIFRMAILLQGQPPKLSNILRWTFRG
jgi:ABC-2 type transport system permease protein